MVVDICLMMPDKNKFDIFANDNANFTYNNYNKLKVIDHTKFIDTILSKDTLESSYSKTFSANLLYKNNDSLKIDGTINYSRISIIQTSLSKKSHATEYIYLDIKPSPTYLHHKFDMQLMYMCYYINSLFIIVFHNNKCISFNEIFEIYNIPFDLFNKRHNYVLGELENEITKLQIDMYHKIRSGNIINLKKEYNLNKICYDRYLCNKLTLIPNKYRTELKEFFNKAVRCNLCCFLVCNFIYFEILISKNIYVKLYNKIYDTIYDTMKNVMSSFFNILSDFQSSNSQIIV